MANGPEQQSPSRHDPIPPLLAQLGTAIFWLVLLFPFELWLHGHYGASLNWPSTGMSLGIAVGAGIKAGWGCAAGGWRAVPLAILAASVCALVLTANTIAAAVVLWALAPSLITGLGGYIASFATGVVLTLPMAYGTLTLMRHWQAADMPWRERFRNDGPRGPMGLRILLSAAVLLLAWLAASEIMFRLAAAYPVVKDVNFFPQIFLVFAVANFVAMASLPDRRSVLRTLLAALVLFEATVALAIAGTAVLATLQSDNILLTVTIELLLLVPVYLGASILAAHRPGGRGDEAKEEAEA